MRYRRDILCLVAAVSSVVHGCTTRSYAPTTVANTLELRIKPGDEIRVVTTQRERLSFEVIEVLDDRFVGVTVKPRRKELRPAGEPVTVPFDDLALLEVTRVEPGGVALVAAVALVTVSAYAAVLGAVPVPPPGP